MIEKIVVLAVVLTMVLLGYLLERRIDKSIKETEKIFDGMLEEANKNIADAKRALEILDEFKNNKNKEEF